MDIDSPSNRTVTSMNDDEEEDDDDNNNDDGEAAYDARLLDLEPLREDSPGDKGHEEDGDEEDIEDGDDDDDDDDDEEEEGGGESESESESEDDDEDEDDAAGVQSLTTNEREILTLLAVDKKLASLLDLAANALAALRPSASSSSQSQQNAMTTTAENSVNSAGSAAAAPSASSAMTNGNNIIITKEDAPKLLSGPSSQGPLKAFEAAAAEYYKAVDDIQLTLRNSIHLIRKARISPRTLMENPSMGSVLSGGPSGDIGGASKDASGSSSSKISIAPGVPASKEAGLGRGAQRMELETWKDGVQALKSLLAAINANEVVNSTHASNTTTSNGQHTNGHSDAVASPANVKDTSMSMSDTP